MSFFAGNMSVDLLLWCRKNSALTEEIPHQRRQQKRGERESVKQHSHTQTGCRLIRQSPSENTPVI